MVPVRGGGGEACDQEGPLLVTRSLILPRNKSSFWKLTDHMLSAFICLLVEN